MNTSIEHLTALQQEQLQTIKEIIIDAVHPEKIILYNVYAATETGPDLSVQSRINRFWGNYDILVVTKRGERRTEADVFDIIVNRCRVYMPVKVIAHHIEYINIQLTEGRYFFTMIYQKGIQLYDANTVSLVEPAPIDYGEVKAIAKKDFERGWKMSQGFFKSALFNMQMGEILLSVFLLHQAAEHALLTILLVSNGYRPCTHNLNKLRQYTIRFSVELALLFPPDDAEDDRLFRLLVEAYIEARYREYYVIKGWELRLLMERIRKLLTMMERICKNRLIQLERRVAGEGNNHSYLERLGYSDRL